MHLFVHDVTHKVSLIIFLNSSVQEEAWEHYNVYQTIFVLINEYLWVETYSVHMFRVEINLYFRYMQLRAKQM